MKRIKSILSLLFLCLMCNLSWAEIVLDGKLSETEWQTAEKHTDFKALAIAENKKVQAQTSFWIVSRQDRIYIGVKCDEPLMEKLKASPSVRSGLWESDAIEIFLAPSGNGSEFYQFLVCYGGMTYSMYYAESGNIKPDPYEPDWKHAVYSGKDFWSIEVELPITAFYMTRQQLWKTEWALNICRKSNTITERSSWAQLKHSYFEPEKFRKLGKFPMRDQNDDLYVALARANIKSVDGNRQIGELTVNVHLSHRGEYEFEGRKYKLEEGVNNLTAPFVFEKEGRNVVPITLKRISDGRVFKRWYPVNAKYQPIKFNISWPQYRNNFYPGQDYSRISGNIDCTIDAPVTLSISGPGIKPQALTLQDGKKDFTFKTAGFEYGTAVIQAETKGAVNSLNIQRLKPIDRTMAWVENGNLVVMEKGATKGKAILPRRMYATYYQGGEAFKKRFDNDQDLHLHNVPASSPTIEPIRLVKNVEETHGIYDVKPPQKLFEELDKIIEKNKNRDFVCYYLSDEPECRNISPEFMKYIYEYVAEKDPYHLMLMASRACEKYIDCCDWFETHPYINPSEEDGKREYRRDFNRLGAFLDEISLSGRSDKVIGFMPSIFSYRFSDTLAVYPTFEEIVCHTWAAMIHGGKSIWPYVYMDMGDRPALYEGTRYIFSTFDALQDFMLYAKRTVLHRSDEYEAVYYENGKEKMFVVVNFTTQEIQADIKGLSGKYMEFRGQRTFDKFNFTLMPHDVIVGTNVKKDAGLLTYDEMKAKIDKLEAERQASPSILFGRDREIEVTSSKPMRFWYKLFDGVRDVLAHSESWGECRFVELSFAKFIPRFSRVNIYGKNVDKAIIKVRKSGEWQTMEPVSTGKGEYFISYDYGKDLSTVKMRVEFPLNHIELYEIELCNSTGDNQILPEKTGAKVQGENNNTGASVTPAWLFDAANAKYQKTHSTTMWFGENSRVEPAGDGGFLVYGTSMHYFTLMPRHWMEIELVKAKRLPEQKYYNWSIHFPNVGKIAGNVNTIPEGLYTINLPEVTSPLEGAGTIYNYNLALHFKYIRLLQEPENYLCAEIEENATVVEPGTKITITLKLTAPCEDVTCKIMQDLGRGLWAFPINGKDSIDLKPANGDNKLWQATIVPQSYPRGFTSSTKRTIMLKAVVLGGKLSTPIYTYIPAAFKDIL